MRLDLDSASKVSELQSFELLCQENICSLNSRSSLKMVQEQNIKGRLMLLFINNLDVSVDDPVFMKTSHCLKKLPRVSSNSEESEI